MLAYRPERRPSCGSRSGLYGLQQVHEKKIVMRKQNEKKNKKKRRKKKNIRKRTKITKGRKRKKKKKKDEKHTLIRSNCSRFQASGMVNRCTSHCATIHISDVGVGVAPGFKGASRSVIEYYDFHMMHQYTADMNKAVAPSSTCIFPSIVRALKPYEVAAFPPDNKR